MSDTFSVHRVPKRVPVPREGPPVRLSNSGGILYYKSEDDVSAGLYDGTIASGASALLTETAWVVSMTSSTVVAQSAPLPQLTLSTTGYFYQLAGDSETIHVQGRLGDVGFAAEFNIETTQPTTDSGTTVPAGTVGFKMDAYGNVNIGPNEMLDTAALNESIPDFHYNAAGRRIYARSLAVSEQGDPPDLILQRAGPDNQYPLPDAGAGASTGLLATTRIGALYWRPWTTPNAGTPGVTTGGSFQTRSGEIYMRCQEDAFDGKTGGSMYFTTTPTFVQDAAHSGSPQDRVLIYSNGSTGVIGAVSTIAEIAGGSRGDFFADQFRIGSNIILSKSASLAADLNSTFRITNFGTPASGAGLEFQYNTTEGLVQAYNRDGAAYKALQLRGLSTSLYAGGTKRLEVDGTGLGFFATAPVAKQNITGSRGGNAALADLLTKLAATGLITDGTS